MFRYQMRRAFLVVGVLACGAVVNAAEPGFVQDFNNGDAGEFGGGAMVEVVPTGGVGGVDDGFLRVSRLSVDRLGARSLAAQLVGELTAEGVTGYSFWLNDVGQDEDVEIHVGVGSAFANFWTTAVGFNPPENEWQEFSVDLTDPSGWVQIQGTGTFEQAVQLTDRLLFRHDTPPVVLEPTQIAGDFGLDRVTVLPACQSPAFVAGDGATSFAARAFDGFVDARAESDDGVNANLGIDAVTLEFTTPLEDADGTPLSAASFTITDTGGAPPGVAGVTTDDGRVVTLQLTNPIAVQERTTIAVNARAQCNASSVLSDSITIGFLPADVDQNGCVAPFDLLRFRTYVNEIAVPDVGVVTDYIDVDRNGVVSPFDLLAFRQLVNGAGNATRSWSGECLP